MNFAFYITGKSGRLEKFLRQASPLVVESIKLIVSDAEIPEEQRMLYDSMGLHRVRFDYDRLTVPRSERNRLLSDFILKNLQEYDIDYCFSFGSHILCGDILEKYENHLINFHPAILPMFPGRRAVDQAVDHGNVLLVGNTAHFMDSGVDTGPIIMQSVTTLQHFFDQDNDYDVILDLQVSMLNKLIDVIERGKLKVDGRKVRIEGADYSVSHIYPDVGPDVK